MIVCTFDCPDHAFIYSQYILCKLSWSPTPVVEGVFELFRVRHTPGARADILNVICRGQFIDDLLSCRVTLLSGLIGIAIGGKRKT